MEEERRLAYVAITRAKRELYLLRASVRLLFGRTQYNPPSRFLGEIPEALLDREEPRQTYRTIGSGYHTGAEHIRTYYSQARDSFQMNREEPKKIKQTTVSERFRPGDRVYHDNFRVGEILSVKPMGADVLYEVLFESVGIKKLMGSYAKMKKM